MRNEKEEQKLYKKFKLNSKSAKPGDLFHKAGLVKVAAVNKTKKKISPAHEKSESTSYEKAEEKGAAMLGAKKKKTMKGCAKKKSCSTKKK